MASQMDSQAANPSTRRISPLTAGLLASGAYALLMSVVYFFPLTLNAIFAGADEGFANFSFGGLLFLIGSTLLIATLAGLGLPWKRAFALPLANPLLVLVVGVVLYNALRLGWLGFFLALATDALILIGWSLLLAVQRRNVWAWALPFFLGVAGAVFVALIYVRTARRFSSACCNQFAPVPYVDDSTAGLSFRMLLIVFLVALLVASLTKLLARSIAGKRTIPDALAQ